MKGAKDWSENRDYDVEGSVDIHLVLSDVGGEGGAVFYVAGVKSELIIVADLWLSKTWLTPGKYEMVILLLI